MFGENICPTESLSDEDFCSTKFFVRRKFLCDRNLCPKMCVDFVTSVSSALRFLSNFRSMSLLFQSFLLSVKGGWSVWSNWSTCTQSCEGGTQTRMRNCDNPTPQNGGAGCDGADNATQSCNTMKCPSSMSFWIITTYTIKNGDQG